MSTDYKLNIQSISCSKWNLNVWLIKQEQEQEQYTTKIVFNKRRKILYPF